MEKDLWKIWFCVSDLHKWRFFLGYLLKFPWTFPQLDFLSQHLLGRGRAIYGHRNDLQDVYDQTRSSWKQQHTTVCFTNEKAEHPRKMDNSLKNNISVPSPGPHGFLTAPLFYVMALLPPSRCLRLFG